MHILPFWWLHFTIICVVQNNWQKICRHHTFSDHTAKRNRSFSRSPEGTAARFVFRFVCPNVHMLSIKGRLDQYLENGIHTWSATCTLNKKLAFFFFSFCTSICLLHKMRLFPSNQPAPTCSVKLDPIPPPPPSHSVISPFAHFIP